MLAWRDLDDPEAGGSEVHASTVARLWAEAGLEVTMRTSFASGQPQMSWRDGYRVIRKAGRYMVFPRAAFSEMMGWHGGRDGLVEIWNGMPFMSPLWARTPHVTWLHHVHAEMWDMTLPPRLATRRPHARVDDRADVLPPHADRDAVELVEARARRRSRLQAIDGARGPAGRRPALLAGRREVADAARRRGRPARAGQALRDPRRRGRRACAPAHPDLELVIVGEGYRREQLEAQIHEAGAERWITLAGHVTDDERRSTSTAGPGCSRAPRRARAGA